LANVDDHIGTAVLGEIKLVLGHIEGDDRLRVLGLCAGDHAKTDRAAPRYHDGVLELDVGALHGMKCTRQRLGECGVRRWQL
jgi:hypothetical protein